MRHSFEDEANDGNRLRPRVYADPPATPWAAHISIVVLEAGAYGNAKATNSAACC
jgi:hypothetical protein